MYSPIECSTVASPTTVVAAAVVVLLEIVVFSCAAVAFGFCCGHCGYIFAPVSFASDVSSTTINYPISIAMTSVVVSRVLLPLHYRNYRFHFHF